MYLLSFTNVLLGLSITQTNSYLVFFCCYFFFNLNYTIDLVLVLFSLSLSLSIFTYLSLSLMLLYLFIYLCRGLYSPLISYLFFLVIFNLIIYLSLSLKICIVIYVTESPSADSHLICLQVRKSNCHSSELSKKYRLKRIVAGTGSQC